MLLRIILDGSSHRGLFPVLFSSGTDENYTTFAICAAILILRRLFILRGHVDPYTVNHPTGKYKSTSIELMTQFEITGIATVSAYF